MPREVFDASVLVIDDALEPEEIEDEALATEAGFARYQELREQFRVNLDKIVQTGIKVILVDRGVDSFAEEVLTDAGIMVVQRISGKELRKAAEHTGARPVKRTGLRKDAGELAKYLEKLEHIRILSGKGKPMATILVGAATEEVVGERERIAKDAAASVQAAVRGGIVPGGGAVELALAREVENIREDIRGMAAYGVDCVIEALKRPFTQIAANAGFNPLEKIGDVIAAQLKEGNENLALDCDTGDVADMFELGVVDPALVKLHALKAAGEIAEAILRIDTIIKKKEEVHQNPVGSDFE
jgi:chaperonin GroEL (HSP60 family)